MDEHCRLRPASAADLAELVRLEHAAFSDPWSARQLRDALEPETALGLVLERPGGGLAGYLVARLVADEAEILTLAVDPVHRRRGFARQLLMAALERMAARGVQGVWLEVRVSNSAAQALYAGAGFVAGGLRRGYYRRPVEDALVLRLDLAPDASARAPVRSGGASS